MAHLARPHGAHSLTLLRPSRAAASLAECLAAWLRGRAKQGLSDAALHAAKRLLLNQLKASAEATSQPAARVLAGGALGAPPGSRQDQRASIWWLGTATTPAHAAAVNGMLCSWLDDGDTHLPTLLHATAGVLPAALAWAEASQCSGDRLLLALALGIELEVACASALAPPPAAGTLRCASGVGAAAACCVLARLDDDRTAQALQLTLAGGGSGTPPASVPTATGMAAQAGLMACVLAQRGLRVPAPASAADMPVSSQVAHSTGTGLQRAQAVLDALAQDGSPLLDIALHTRPAGALAQAPIDATLAVLAHAAGRQPQRLLLALAPQAWQLVHGAADGRGPRGAQTTPTALTALTALAALTAPTAQTAAPTAQTAAPAALMAQAAPGRPDLRLCVATAWLRGAVTAEDLQPPCNQHPRLLDLQARVELLSAPNVAGITGCTLEVTFTDGSRQTSNVDHFLGSPGQPLSDQQLSELFRAAAEDLVLPARAGHILQLLWGLQATPDIRNLTALLQPLKPPQPLTLS